MRRERIILLKGPDGKSHQIPYQTQSRKLLAPLKLETFLALEKLTPFTVSMLEVITSRKAWVASYEMLMRPWDEDEAQRDWLDGCLPTMLRLAALHEVQDHPEVHRMVERLDLHEHISDPLARHEFITRHSPHDMDHAKHFCGYYPEEFIELLERRKRWGVKRIVLNDPPSAQMACLTYSKHSVEYLPLQQKNGQWFFSFSGLPLMAEQQIEQALVVASNDEGKRFTKSNLYMIGPKTRSQWVLHLRRGANSYELV